MQTCDVTPLKPSIHRQRAWFYVLWTSLLLLSAWALYLWETPLQQGHGRLVFQFDISDVPERIQISVRRGAQETFSADPWLPCAVTMPRPGVFCFHAEHRLARRRWVNRFIPRLTDNLVAVRFCEGKRKPRYFLLDLHEDVRQGVVRIDRAMFLEIGCAWDGLSTSLESELGKLRDARGAKN